MMTKLIFKFSDAIDALQSRLHELGFGNHRRQVGAICYRFRKGELEILLITTRRTGRWIIPKGWPMEDKSDAAAAAQEAYEEAGVIGTISDAMFGRFSIQKFQDEQGYETIMVDAYLLHVDHLAEDFPEQGQRERQWFPASVAALQGLDTGLSKLIKRADRQRDRFQPGQGQGQARA